MPSLNPFSHLSQMYTHEQRPLRGREVLAEVNLFLTHYTSAAILAATKMGANHLASNALKGVTTESSRNEKNFRISSIGELSRAVWTNHSKQTLSG